MCRHIPSFVARRIDDERWVEYQTCQKCHAWLPLGPSNDDSIAGNEFSLAEDIADLCVLWEPGKEREDRIEYIVDIHTTLYAISSHATTEGE